jgi:hypothetical protein
MMQLYDWSRWFGNAKEVVAAPPADAGLIPSRSTHPAELVNVSFRKAEGVLGGIDRIFTFRITSGTFNNHVVNYKVKAEKPGRIKALLDVIIPDKSERSELIPNRDAKVWLNKLKGRPAIIVVDVFKEWNYIADIRA